MQLTATMRYHLTLVRMAIMKKSMQYIDDRGRVAKREPSYNVGGNANCYSYNRKQLWKLI